MNELILIGSVFLYFGAILLFKRLWGKSGLIAIICLASVMVNIEVLNIVNIFGMNMAMGCVLFNVIFLSVQVLNESYGEKAAKTGVHLGLVSMVTMVVVTQLVLLYEPAESDWVRSSMAGVFTLAPRIVGASLTAYFFSQYFNVKFYRWIWDKTTNRSGSREKLLWLRNTVTTCIAQVIDNTLFTCLAFIGIFEADVIVSIIIMACLIAWVLAAVDTPFMYLARRIKCKEEL